jgi:hypothetical protein
MKGFLFFGGMDETRRGFVRTAISSVTILYADKKLFFHKVYSQNGIKKPSQINERVFVFWRYGRDSNPRPPA